ncbi:rhomboid family intramembrane serine protease [Pontibacter ruber]|uniref:Rhomboid family intramembrane serine protease n=1 Tax=Pontibacter ruber TaxID=1343895 RepID=A0ABW5CW19_9BACT|nr:rhomboid family intramembrane serine protease [Pontibacter ruber]
MPQHFSGNVSPELQEENSRFAHSFLPGALFVALLWLISLLEYLTDANLSWLGILPRNFFGLIGLVTAPLIHGGLVHLLSNSFPLVLLSGFILFMHRHIALRVIAFVYFSSGILTWFIGRPAYHVGASGVIYGLAGFLLFNGLLRRDRAAMAVSLAMLFLYGGLFYGLFPEEERISWEGHLGGLLSGLLAAVLFVEDKVAVQKPADEVLEEIATLTVLQQQHSSSTIGKDLYKYKINYRIAPPAENQKFQQRYVLNKQTGMVEPPTHGYGVSS